MIYDCLWDQSSIIQIFHDFYLRVQVLFDERLASVPLSLTSLPRAADGVTLVTVTPR